ncbi:MAG TPA: DciA family protein [Ignavibacteriales bacterium]|nr:DciA family protein [Ignavibacteriales bacterium]
MPDAKSFSEIFQKDETLANLRAFIQSAEVVEKFSELFPDLKKLAKAKKVDKQVLYLKVENSVLRSELKFRQKIIIDKINSHFRKELIKSIKFVA